MPGRSVCRRSLRMGTWTNGLYQDAWEAFMKTERVQLAERASGKMRRAIG